MDMQIELAGIVASWQAEGKWIDRGRWHRAKNGMPEYHPTRREIQAKCKLLRTLGGRGANKRAPRDGEFAVPTTRGL
jgi:hypothetical protein